MAAPAPGMTDLGIADQIGVGGIEAEKEVSAAGVGTGMGPGVACLEVAGSGVVATVDWDRWVVGDESRS